jgi:hypothetical protein
MPEATFARLCYSLEFACHRGTDSQEWASDQFDSPWRLALTDRVPLNQINAVSDVAQVLSESI